MPTFTPPPTSDVPPISVADNFRAPPTSVTNPQGMALMKFYRSRVRGVNVFKMSDGTYQRDDVTEPYPATAPNPGQPEVQANNALNWSWYNGVGTVSALPQPTVTVVYYGGHSYTVSSAEAAALTAAGYGAYIT